MFTMEMNDTDVIEPDQMEANMRAEEHWVEVDFGDLTNLGGTSAERDYASKYSRATSVISPCALEKKLKGMKQIEWDCDILEDEASTITKKFSARKADEEAMDTTTSDLKRDIDVTMKYAKLNKEEVASEETDDTM